MNTPKASPGLKEALCAWGFFRRRHDLIKSRKVRGTVMIKDRNLYREKCQLARNFIRQARAQGWRGSILAAVNRNEHHYLS